jgi:hypothetical protein
MYCPGPEEMTAHMCCRLMAVDDKRRSSDCRQQGQEEAPHHPKRALMVVVWGKFGAFRAGLGRSIPGSRMNMQCGALHVLKTCISMVICISSWALDFSRRSLMVAHSSIGVEFGWS